MPADDPDRPPFRGCVVCYTAEMTLYGARRLRAAVGGERDATAE